MEDLFSTTLAVDDQNIVYRVVFDNEQYTFHSDSSENSFPSFSLRRENDEWHELQTLPPDLKRQAIDSLEKYLLKQH